MLKISSVEKQMKHFAPSGPKQTFMPDDQKTYNFLLTVKMYLQSSPSEEYLVSEVKKLQSRKQSILDNFDLWKANNPSEWESKYYESKDEGDRKRAMGEIFSYFKKVMGMTDINRQLKTLKFILDHNSTVLKNEVAHR